MENMAEPLDLQSNTPHPVEKKNPPRPPSGSISLQHGSRHRQTPRPLEDSPSTAAHRGSPQRVTPPSSRSAIKGIPSSCGRQLGQPIKGVRDSYRCPPPTTPAIRSPNAKTSSVVPPLARKNGSQALQPTATVVVPTKYAQPRGCIFHCKRHRHRHCEAGEARCPMGRRAKAPPIVPM